MNILGKIFLNYRTDGKKFFVRCRRTYVLNNRKHFPTHTHNVTNKPLNYL